MKLKLFHSIIYLLKGNSFYTKQKSYYKPLIKGIPDGLVCFCLSDIFS